MSASTIEDILAITAVHDEYCLRLEVDTFEHWLELFTEDAEYEVFRRVLRGHDEIRAMLSQAPDGVHFGGPARIEIDGDVAHTVQSYSFSGDDDAHSNNGWYFRTLVRTPEGWKISRMRVKVQKRSGVTRP